MKKLISITGLLFGMMMVVRFSSAETITIKGSTTVLPIAQKAAESFMNENANVDISVQGGGSGVGIASIIDGTADIGDASRPIKDKELEQAVSNKVMPKAHVIAMDAIAVVVNPSNPIEGLTKQQLKDIYTGKISSWLSIGGSGTIVVISRDSASGTFETFNEKALDKAKVRADALLQASNQAVLNTVARTPGAIGYIGLGYINDTVKGITIDGVMPSKETALKGEYSLARPLFMYTNGKPKGAVKEFIDYILSDKGQFLVEEVGYIGLFE